MATYHEAGFTLDSHAIIDENAPPAISVEETGRADDLAAYSDEYRETLAGPVRLGCEDSGLWLTATVEGVADAQRVALDWGDGDVSDLQVGEDTLTAEHDYRMAGVFTVTATAQVGKDVFEVAKKREMGTL